MMRQRGMNLIDQDGRFNFGRYTNRINNVNPLDLKSGYWGALPKCIKNKRLKEWHAYMVGGKHHYILIATMNLKLFSVLKIMIHDKRNNHTWGTSMILPLHNLKISENLNDDSMYVHHKSTHVYANHFLDSDRIELGFSFVDELSGVELSGFLKSGHVINEPQVSVLPLKNSAGLYTHKQLMEVGGQIMIGKELINLSSRETCLIMDDQKVYYPYYTEWDWATASGIVGDDYCGFTVSDIRAVKGDWNENGFWKNGKLHQVPNVRFCRNKSSGTWTIVDENGLVDILFKPVAKHVIRRNFGIAGGSYEGPFGWFSGHLTSEDGETLHINGMFGMGEKMNLRL